MSSVSEPPCCLICGKPAVERDYGNATCADLACVVELHKRLLLVWQQHEDNKREINA